MKNSTAPQRTASTIKTWHNKYGAIRSWLKGPIFEATYQLDAPISYAGVSLELLYDDNPQEYDSFSEHEAHVQREHMLELFEISSGENDPTELTPDQAGLLEKIEAIAREFQTTTSVVGLLLLGDYYKEFPTAEFLEYRADFINPSDAADDLRFRPRTVGEIGEALARIEEKLHTDFSIDPLISPVLEELGLIPSSTSRARYHHEDMTPWNHVRLILGYISLLILRRDLHDQSLHS